MSKFRRNLSILGQSEGRYCVEFVNRSHSGRHCEIRKTHLYFCLTSDDASIKIVGIPTDLNIIV